MQISQVWAENWRSFGNRRQIDLTPLTLLIGPNNAGKSNILHLLSIVRKYVEFGPNVLRNLVEDIRPGAQAARIGVRFDGERSEFSIEWSRTGQVLEAFQSDDFIYKVDGDRNLAITRGNIGGSTPRATGASALDIVAKHGAARPQTLIAALAGYSIWRCRPDALDHATQVARKVVLGPHGESAPAMLDHLRDRYPDRFEALQRDLIRCAPELAGVVAEATDQPGNKEIYFRERSGVILPSRSVSEGLKLLLFVLLILHSPDPPEILAFEEIEHGLHPRRLQDVIGFLRQLTRSPKSPQILVTTHSPLVLDQFRDSPEEVLVVERDEKGCTTTTRLDRRLEKFPPAQTDAALGDLWYSGVLGGVPS